MERKIQLIPSIASADQLLLGKAIEDTAEWDHLHIDIEDGNFVPNITFGEKTVRAIAGAAGQELDAHILANDPCRYLPLFHECGFRRAAAHIEALPYPLEFLKRARSMGMKAGLALNFVTPAEAVLMFAEHMDYVIVMTAEPDNEGQHFYPPILRKIRHLREILLAGIGIWADGGVNEGNMFETADAGADTLIMGRCVFGTDSPIKTLRTLRNKLNG